jgi:hypothetical protein
MTELRRHLAPGTAKPKMHANAYTLLREVAAREEISLAVRGTCMDPHIPEGETVRVRARRAYWPGDVLVFRSRAGGLVAHRLVGWRPAGFVTKGDGCAVHDAPVERAQIIGAAAVPVRMRERLRAIAAFASIVWRRLW